MAVLGKIVGTLLGSIGGPCGAIVGGIAGHLLDAAETDGKSPAAGLGGCDESDIVFLSTFIGLSVAVLGVSRRNSTGRLRAVSDFLVRSLDLSAADRDVLQRILHDTYKKRHLLDIPALCASFVTVSSCDGRLLLVEFLLGIASQGGNESEDDLIRGIAGSLGFTSAQYREICRRVLPPETETLGILGLSPGASNDEIRRAYRRLANQYHPDKHAHREDGSMQFAEERFKVIQSAYSKLKQLKGL